MKKYECSICGWVYDEETGDVDEGINAGTRWQDHPDDWVCPVCGAEKEHFNIV